MGNKTSGGGVDNTHCASKFFSSQHKKENATANDDSSAIDSADDATNNSAIMTVTETKQINSSAKITKECQGIFNSAHGPKGASL